MSRQQQTLRQHAAGTGPSVAAFPASGTFAPGTSFTVDVQANAGGTTFNALQGNVAVSSNLVVTGIEGPNLYNGPTPPVGSGYINNSTDPKYCYFTYLTGSTSDLHPTLTNPSFAAFGSYTPSCTIYTLHVQVAAGATGVGTVTFSNVQAAGNNTTITLIPQNGSYTLGTPITPSISPQPTSMVTPTSGSIDTTKPTVSITDPLTGTSVKRNTTKTIKVSASDNVGVTKVVITVSGTNCPVAKTGTTTYACSWSIPAKRKVQYTIQATASDAANNFQSATSTVTAN